MLDHLNAGDQIEDADIECRDLARHVADIEAHGLGMGRRRRNILARRINAGHAGTQPRQRLAHQPRAAPDIERGLARQRLG